ncbi:MAG: hypothetical protein IPM91_00800 [Bacteroidetes bacterium]|nr:hypothetical protein [Bacteroidota bacterium]
MREKIIERKDLGLGNNENYSDFKNFSNLQLQFISDFLTTKVSSQGKYYTKLKLIVKYVNGIELEIPQWYLFHHGHDLEEHLKAVFPQLKRFNNTDDLKKEVIVKVIDDLPELISYDILELFIDIQTH